MHLQLSKSRFEWDMVAFFQKVKVSWKDNEKGFSTAGHFNPNCRFSFSTKTFRGVWFTLSRFFLILIWYDPVFCTRIKSILYFVCFFFLKVRSPSWDFYKKCFIRTFMIRVGSQNRFIPFGWYCNSTTVTYNTQSCMQSCMQSSLASFIFWTHDKRFLFLLKLVQNNMLSVHHNLCEFLFSVSVKLTVRKRVVTLVNMTDSWFMCYLPVLEDPQRLASLFFCIIDTVYFN